ncbi:MAG: M23 family metallopeptidase [Cyclobacteriaceae bacterium]
MRLKFICILLVIIITGLLIPQNFTIPVLNATQSDYHPDSFWYEPWGASGTHKGVDIFAEKGQKVMASTGGLVIYSGKMKYGGKVIMVLGAKWRVHYYAHLDSSKADVFDRVSMGEDIGTVGNSGNAKGKQPHLHYSITSLVPYLWRYDDSTQGWKKMFYLNPIEYF